MTNKEDEQNPPCDPRVAALMAVHLVGQVLDEAYVIANAAKDSGRPWRYVSSLKKLRSCRLNEIYDEDMTFTVSNGDSQYMKDNNFENLPNTIVTSTPQKDNNAVNATKSKNESSFIGQGDEEFEVTHELRKSTSMFINHLFDMSDVEYLKNCNETDVSIDSISTNQNELIKTMAKIMDSYVNNALDIVFEREVEGDTQTTYRESSDVTNDSSYSFLSDAFDIATDVTFNINEGAMSVKTENSDLIESVNENKQSNYNDIAFCENAYLTLNRDYEQYSEEDEPVLQDPKSIMPMQEVELLTANTSNESVARCQKEKTELARPTVASSAAGSKKSTLVRRCRIQGARLLSCLRGWWWRRKLTGKRRDPRGPGSIRGLCPLSPDARRRASSLLDHRNLRTPSPSKEVWKFNTVNEALVHSSRWKEFGLKMSLNESDEF